MWDGTVERFADVDHRTLTDWITSIPFSEWPQQHPINGPRPAMISDLNWHGFGSVAYSVDRLLVPFLGHLRVSNRMLSVVMPGQDIEPHKDIFSDEWQFRVHVPLITNFASRFIVDGVEHLMRTGSAYRVNISREHSVYNKGCIPRIHFMFDCYN